MDERRTLTGALGAILLLGATLLVTASCGDEFSTAGAGGGCEADLDACGPGTVCWPVDEGFACIDEPRQRGDVGDQCVIFANEAQCKHGNFCHFLRNGSPGSQVCQPRCNPDGSSNCPSGVCVRLSLTGYDPIGVCQPP